jgi:diaminopimelate decarboxylase
MNKRLLPDSAGVNTDGELEVAGHSLADLARLYGTPYYLYDAETVHGQVEHLKSLLAAYPGEQEITYAAKAYFSVGFARKLNALGLGVDVVSLGEMQAAQRAGFPPDRVHLHGNNKSRQELVAALDWGLQRIVVDSLEELEYLNSLAEGKGKCAEIWLRITPGVAVDTHQYLQTAVHASKFGLPITSGQALQAIQAARSAKGIQLMGLHMHLGSQFHQAGPFKEAVRLLAGLSEQAGWVPAELSPGGGWGVAYRPEDQSGEPQEWVQTIIDSVTAEFGGRGWALPRLVLEPGRWLCARAGMAVYSVGTAKIASDGTYFVSIDGGMADNLRPALYQAQYTAIAVARPQPWEDETRKTAVAGRFCESGDILIQEAQLPELKRGDLLAIPVSGAYQLSMASNYNLTPRPAVLWLEPGNVDVLHKREELWNSGWWDG